MAIEMLQPKQEKLRAIEVLKSVLIQGTPCRKGQQVRIPEADAHDLVHAGQAKFITPADVKK
jgi:hypothetical protein